MTRFRLIAVTAIIALVVSAMPAIGAPSPLQMAKKALKTASKANKRSKRALKRARRGPSGRVGATGAAGAPGANGTNGAKGQDGAAGATGPVGPSSSFEAVNTNQVVINGTDANSATSVATLSNLAAGDYLVIVRVQLNSNSSVTTVSSRVACQASLGAKLSLAVVDIGVSANSVEHAPVTAVFNSSIASSGDAKVQCWHETLSGGAPNASDSYVEALRVGNATSQSVSG